MKYLVDVNGERFEVDSGGDGGLTVPGGVELTLDPGGRTGLWRVGDRSFPVAFERGVGSDGRPLKGRYTVWLSGERFAVVALDERSRAVEELAARLAPARGGSVSAPMPGLIVKVSVAVGDRVKEGDGVVVMEAMKMENELRVRTSGVVRALLVSPGDAVEKGALLVEVDPD